MEQEALSAANVASWSDLDQLARSLGVPIRTLAALGCGVCQPASGGEGYSFPEVDGDRRVVGVATRSLDGDKAMLSGYTDVQTHGLFVPLDLDLTSDEPLYLPEGPTDTAALRAMELAAAGRPSNCGGAEDLAQLPLSSTRPIMLIADRDQKPDGSWPGLDGARRVARQLRQLLGREVWIALPPGGAKDVRAWLNAQQPDLADADALRRLGWALEEQLWAGALTVEQADAMLAIAASDGATEASALPITDPAALVRLAMAQAADPVAERYVDQRPASYGVLGLRDAAAERCHRYWHVRLSRLDDAKIKTSIYPPCDCNTCSGCWTRKRWEAIEHAIECVNWSYALGRPVRVLEGLSEAEYTRVTGQLRDEPTRLRVLTDTVAGQISLYTPADLGPGVGQEFETADEAVRHIAATILALIADESGRHRVTFSGEWQWESPGPKQWQVDGTSPHDMATTRRILSAHGITEVLESRHGRGRGYPSLSYSIPAHWTPQQMASLDADLSDPLAKLVVRERTLLIRQVLRRRPAQTPHRTPGRLGRRPNRRFERTRTAAGEV